MERIVLVLGRTGAGKSTLCEKLTTTFHAHLLSFAKCGREFAHSLGYGHIRKCYNELGPTEFKVRFTKYFESVIGQAIKEYSCLVIDGLYVDNIAMHLKRSHSASIIYIDVPTEICYKRIANREGMSLKEVQAEYRSKESLKKHLGNEHLISMADFVIDGNQPPDAVYLNAVGNMTTLWSSA